MSGETQTPTAPAPAAVASSAEPQPFSYPSLAGPAAGAPAPAAPTTGDPARDKNIDLLKDVTLKVKVELGRGRMHLRDVLRLCEGSVVELDKLAGDPLEIYVNERLVGKGEVLVLNENFCVRITKVFSPEECLQLRGSA